MAREIADRSRAVTTANLLAFAAGAAACGAIAIGALALGRVAIGRLAIKKAHLGAVEIDDLTVRRLRVVENEAHD